MSGVVVLLAAPVLLPAPEYCRLVGLYPLAPGGEFNVWSSGTAGCPGTAPRSGVL